MRVLFACLLGITLIGCSQGGKQWLYEAAQENNRQRCEQHVDSENRDCTAENSTSYETYTEERDKLLEDRKTK